MRRAGCPTDLDLERALMGEPVAAADHIPSCEHCAARVAAMNALAERFATQVFPRLRERIGPLSSRPAVRWGWALALLPVAAAVLLFVRGTRGPADDYIGAKGGNAAVLEVYVGEGREGRRLASGDRVHPGDGLRFFVSSRGHRAFIFTVDANGHVSRLYPREGKAPLEAEGVLPGGAVLDEVTGPERVYAVFPNAPLAFDEVQAAVERVYAAGATEAVRTVERLPLEAAQESLLLEKVPR